MSDEQRRQVRVAHEVFDRLDEILEVFATRFDALPRLIDQRGDYRVLISNGTLVHAFAVVGQLNADETIEIVRVDIDLEA